MQTKTKRLGGRGVRNVRARSVPSREETNQQINLKVPERPREDVCCHNLFSCFNRGREAACRDGAEGSTTDTFYHEEDLEQVKAKRKT